MYEELKKIIDESDNIVFFGGAGVSTESGVPDFRSGFQISILAFVRRSERFSCELQTASEE